MKSLRPLLIIAIALLAFSCDKEEEIPVKIFPGQGIDVVKIGDSEEDVTSALGEGEALSMSGSYYSGGTTIYFYYLSISYDHLGISFFVDGLEDAVLSISLESPYDGKTKEKLGINSTKAEVEAVFGMGDEDGDDVEYPARGIDFTYGSSNLVEEIQIYEPD